MPAVGRQQAGWQRAGRQRFGGGGLPARAGRVSLALALGSGLALAPGSGCERGERSRRPLSATVASRPIVVPITAEPGVLDPLRAADPAVAVVTVLLHEGLVVAGDSLALAPGVARSWSCSQQGKRLRFELDPRARFDGGRPLRARDVRFTLERLLDARTRTPFARLLAELDGAGAYLAGKVDSVRGIVLVDSLTVELRGGRVAGALLAALGDPQAAIVPEGLTPGSEPPGLGPWRVVAREPGRALRLEPRPDYHGAPPRAAALRLEIIGDRWRRQAAFAAGELDLCPLAGGQPLPHRAGAYPAAAVTAWTAEAVVINCQKYPFDARRVRQALNLAVDLEAIEEAVRPGSAVRAAGPLPPSVPGAAAGIVPYSYDPARARELLAAAGFARGFHMEIWHEASPLAAQVLEAMRMNLRAVRIELTAVEKSGAELREALEEGQADAVLCTVRPAYLGLEAMLSERFHSNRFGAAGNLARFESRPIDRALARLERAWEPRQRAQRSAALQAALHRAAPWIFLWHPRRVVAVAPEISGYRPLPDPRLQRFLELRRCEGGDGDGASAGAAGPTVAATEGGTACGRPTRW